MTDFRLEKLQHLMNLACLWTEQKNNFKIGDTHAKYQKNF